MTDKKIYLGCGQNKTFEDVIVTSRHPEPADMTLMYGQYSNHTFMIILRNIFTIFLTLYGPNNQSVIQKKQSTDCIVDCRLNVQRK